ncbi:Shikimate kinase 2 [Phytobacter ursingii]|uniref:Shikimate kinase 1 n=1 Tax=Phytobacter ursingii TaxID=1972431 RepID=A0AB35RJJ2_9ENTR|nr:MULTISPECIES: shikimate kinase AroL [Enterobacteriaceae]AUV02377.1 shikimate kinase AroL [Enterobacteriaceae bacterium ENNIH1]RDT52795.1 shikimate kinase AroL [Escherichia coli]MDV2861953.1 shikimate kinase AroL [Phytobacter ursingii]VTP15368.1 Shikimate kinase 2 [Phytobacter ursingii]GJL33406.1 shikimate kinase 2 [Enterobacter hormaechei]
MTLPIFLIGARGCGKTTVGHALSQLHVCQFVDTDHWLQEQAQMTVAQLVSKEGWHGFRARETEALEAVTAPARVVATGGGIILSEYNRKFMREQGVVIYLSAPVSVLVDRLEAYPKESQRPTLTGKPIREEVGEILAGREALYREAAHHVVNAAQDLDLVIAEIQTALRLARAS